MEELAVRARTLSEALPYIRRFHDKTIIVKYGGNFDDLDPAVKEELMEAVRMMTIDLYRQSF